MIFVAVSHVNAAQINENSTTNLTDELNLNYKLSDNDNGNFSSLSDEINSSSQTKSLKLTKDYAFNRESDEKYIEGIVIEIDNLIIDGAGHTIDANKQARIFNIKSDNVVLKNIIITNGNSNSDGGAINWVGTNGKIINSTFKNSQADTGGAIYFKKAANVTDCEFINNKAANFGGAIRFDSESTVINCNFKNNFAKYLGGGIGSYQQTNVFNSSFINNTASDGGGIYYNLYGVVENTLFYKNYAIGYGGAITSANTVRINNSTFTNNSGKYAGAICFKGDGHIKNSFFNENSADLAGAIMASGYEFEILNSEFYHNIAIQVSSLYCDGKNLKIENTSFKNINSTLSNEFYSEVENSILNNLTYQNITKKQETIKNETNKNNNPIKTNSKKKTTIIVKSKAFNSSVKIKKYYVKLKSSTKILKNKRITLKIKGKTYVSKTNNHGKAIFKIKLRKKGNFKVLIKFNGDETYKSSKKIIKIKIK